MPPRHSHRQVLTLARDRCRQLAGVPRVRQMLASAGAGAADFVSLPVLVLLTTPLLVRWLGMQNYGIWLLVNVLTASGSVFVVSLGEATVRFGADCLGRRDGEGLRQLVGTTLAISAAIGSVGGGLIALLGPVLATHVFRIAAEHRVEAAHAIAIGGLVLFLQSLDAVMRGVLRAHQAYPLAMRRSVAARLVLYAGVTLTAATGAGLLAVMWVTAAATGLRLVLDASAARSLIPGLPLLPWPHGHVLRHIRGYALATSLQAVAGAAFAQADKILVGVFLGPAPLVYYTVSQQLAEPVHRLPMAALDFVVPEVSHSRAAAGPTSLRRRLNWSMALNAGLSLGLGLPLLLLGKPFLRLWMGASFAQNAYPVLSLLTVAFIVLSLCITPTNFLLGLGRAHLIAVVAAVSAVLSTLAIWLLVARWGVIGAASGRLVYSLCTLSVFWPLRAEYRVRATARLVPTHHA